MTIAGNWLNKYFSAVVRYLGTNLPMRAIFEIVGEGVVVSDEKLDDGTPVTRMTFSGTTIIGSSSENFDWSPTTSPNVKSIAVQKSLDTANNTTTTLWSRTQEDESTIGYTATVLARGANNQNFELDIRATYSRTDGGAPTAIRAPSQANPPDAGNPAGWNAVFDKNGNDVRVRFTGPAAAAARASAIVNVQIVKLDASGLLDLTTLASTGWWRGSFAGTGWTWAGTASAGSSGSRNLTEATNPPTAGTAVDGYTPAHFNGTNQKLGHAGPVAPTFVSTTQWSTWVMFKATAAFAFGNDNQRYNSPHFWASNDSGVGVGFDSNGIFVQQADSSPTQHDTNIACATGAWHVLFAWWDGALLWLQLDNGTPVSVACTSMYSGVSSAQLVVGTNWNASTWLQGDIMDQEIRNVAFTGTERADIYTALKTKYPSAALP